MPEPRPSLTPVPGREGLFRIEAGTNGWLLVRDGRSLLIDCPSVRTAEVIAAAGLPHPGTILHTHVQEEHCREGDSFASAGILVEASSADLAARTPRYEAECGVKWGYPWPWDHLGEETWGIGGCIIERPPAAPLRLAGTFAPGEAIRRDGFEMQVVPLPGHGKRSVGFSFDGLLFAGDLLLAGGLLVNLFDLERGYGLTKGHEQHLVSLDRAAALAPRLWLPATGPIPTDAVADALRLRGRLRAFLDRPCRRADEKGGTTNREPLRRLGRMRETLPGVFQSDNFGNIVLFIDAQGRGLIVDPDNCVWMRQEESEAAMREDLDRLEKEAGLKRIEIALATHYHGDHVRFAPLLKERYGTRLLTTPRVAAVLERPEDFPYPCRIPWYSLPFSRLAPDGLVEEGGALDWNGIAVRVFHAPGHCSAHAGFSLDWRGQRLVCSGDVLQYGSGPIRVGLPVLYNDTGWPDRGQKIAYERFAAERPAWVLGGHSHAFADPDGSILRDWIAAAAEAEEAAAGLVAPGTLFSAMTPACCR